MSELQAALLAIGFGAIIAVYVFGWWQQRKYRRKFGTAFKASHADALYQENAEKAASPDAGDASGAVTGPYPDEEAQNALTAEAAGVMPDADRETPVGKALDESCALLDTRSDFIIELRLNEPAPAAVLDGLWQRKFDFGKPVQVCGLALNTRQWERAIAESQTLYERFRVALQLVDRSGAISAAKLADFSDLLLGIARRIKADAAAPEINDAHRRAIELDAFCADVDQMAGVNLMPPGERLLLGGKIAQAVALQGMTLEADGAFHLLDAQGRSLFALMNQDTKPFQHHTLETSTTTGLTLLLDVPRTEQPAARFDQMLRLAHECAKELQVNVVDDNRVLLSDKGLDLIRAQIAEVEAKMCDNGIVPGSAQARRLFA
jgi:FtsZ-interacting cell division protein ZipA